MNPKKKILYIITQGTWGGAQRYVCDLALNLAKNHDITIAIGEQTGTKDLQKKIKKWNEKNGIRKVEIIQLKHLVRRISPIHDILAIFELRKLYKKLKPNVIHLNSSKTGILGSLANFPLSPFPFPLIYTVHGWVFNEPLSKFKKWLYEFLEKTTAKFKDKIIVLSKKEYNDAIELGIKKEKLEIIPIGIEKIKFLEKQEAIKKLGNFEGLLFGTIANFYKTKGLDILIKTIAQNEQLKQYQFIIIGDGPERNKLQSLITNYQLKNIHLLGSVENAAQYLKAFDCFVLPSRKEGLPYTILEAQQANLPIIATKVGAIEEVVENGIIVEPKIKELSKALLNFVNKKPDTQIASDFKYKLKTMVDSIENLYYS